MSNETTNESGKIEYVVRAKDLTKEFVMGNEVTRALKGISIDIKRGEYISIIGPSGSGKSTFFNMIGGLDRPNSGSVFINDVDMAQLRKAYFNTRVLSPKEHEAMVKLLQIFAQHLSMVSNQIVVQKQNAEPPVITRAKEYIREHQTEDISLGQVAKAVNTSTFFFCKMFKKVTGINFTDYVSRVRIENAKNLLLNPNLRVSEIAYEVGFQSLTHFNRVFKKIIGQSPTDYRAKLSHG